MEGIDLFVKISGKGRRKNFRSLVVQAQVHRTSKNNQCSKNLASVTQRIENCVHNFPIRKQNVNKIRRAE